MNEFQVEKITVNVRYRQGQSIRNFELEGIRLDGYQAKRVTVKVRKFQMEKFQGEHALIEVRQFRGELDPSR